MLDTLPVTRPTVSMHEDNPVIRKRCNILFWCCRCWHNRKLPVMLCLTRKTSWSPNIRRYVQQILPCTCTIHNCAHCYGRCLQMYIICAGSS